MRSLLAGTAIAAVAIFILFTAPLVIAELF